MKRLIAIALLSCAALAGCAKPDYQTLDGESGRFSDHRGRWMLVNYWAEWCKPCIKEMPELKAFSDQHRDDAVIFTVNFDGATGDELLSQVKKLGIEVPVLTADPALLLGIERPTGLPTTYIFGPDGKLAARLEGEQTAASLTAALVATPATPPVAPPAQSSPAQ